jgi:hypothetical protein
MMIHMTCRYRRGGVLVVPHGPPDAALGVAVGVGLDEGDGVVRVPPG